MNALRARSEKEHWRLGVVVGVVRAGSPVKKTVDKHFPAFSRVATGAAECSHKAPFGIGEQHKGRAVGREQGLNPPFHVFL